MEMVQSVGKARKRAQMVFISHAPADHALARGLADELRKAEFQPWLAEEELEPGGNWAKELGRALESSDFLVVILSKHSLKSWHVRNDWDFAVGSARHAGRLVPVITQGTKMESVPWIAKHLRPVRSGADWKLTSRAVVRALRKLPEAG
jgi:hypothetical protein